LQNTKTKIQEKRERSFPYLVRVEGERNGGSGGESGSVREVKKKKKGERR